MDKLILNGSEFGLMLETRENGERMFATFQTTTGMVELEVVDITEDHETGAQIVIFDDADVCGALDIAMASKAGKLDDLVRDTMNRKKAREENRAELGVRNGFGFAQLGDEVEAVEIIDTGNETDDGSRAASQALKKLEDRLGRTLTYWIGPTHPRHC